MHERAGLRAEPSDLIDVDALLRAFTEVIPDPAVPAQRVVFGTSGHRGTALNGSFNEAHIAAISLAIAEYRAAQGIEGPLFLGGDTHALSTPALEVAASVLSAAGVHVLLPTGSGDETFVPTPALSRAILAHNHDRAADDPHRADGIKCVRSWKYFDPATADKAYPLVTPRDAQALKELGVRAG